MRVPRVPGVVIPKAPRVPTWDAETPAPAEARNPPRQDTFSETVIRAALNVAERSHAQIAAAPGRSIAAQTMYLHVDSVDSY